ncbi:MAG: hypothetical protein ABWX82_12415 [Leifsonia sp.]
MTLEALRADALTSTPDGFAIRLGLPWIRSLPVHSLLSPEVSIDGATVAPLTIAIGDRIIDPTALGGVDAWWFIQDRIVLRARQRLAAGPHEVSVTFRLVIPYLQAGPDGPLTLPFRVDRPLVIDAPAPIRSVSRDVA